MRRGQLAILTPDSILAAPRHEIEIELEVQPTIIDLPPSEFRVLDPEPRQDPKYRTWLDQVLTWGRLAEDEPKRWLFYSDDLLLTESRADGGTWESIITVSITEGCLAFEGHGRTRWHSRRQAESKMAELAARLNILVWHAHHPEEFDAIGT